MNSDFLFTIIIITFSLIGIVLVAFGLYLFNLSIRSKNWPIQRGFICKSKVFNDMSMETNQTFSKLNVIFKYTIGGQEFKSSNLYWGHLLNSNINQQLLINKYPVGTSVDIYYNPIKPSQSVIEPGLRLETIIIVITGIILILISIVLKVHYCL